MWGGGGRVLPPKACALDDPETVLLVDDGQSEVLERHVVLYHGVGADEYVQRAVSQLPGDSLPFLPACRAGEQPDVHPQGGSHRTHTFVVLRGKNLCRSHYAGLCAVVNSDEHCHQRHYGLARSDIALQQTVHLPA